jgi:4-hydroxybenzoate polyprenyltransferase
MAASLRSLLSLVRFSHTVFAMPFALISVIAAWSLDGAAGSEGVASGPLPDGWLLPLVGVVVCMVAARTAAMAFNRLVDRDIDALNPRTASRHLPAGELSVAQVMALVVSSSLLFVAGTLLFLPNWLPLVLSLPVLAWLLGYSYAKRFTMLAHVWLGAALGMAPVAAWIALRGQAVLADPADLLPSLLLGVAVMLWVAGFDMIYACQDAAFDSQSGLHSIPAVLGVPRALRLATVFHVVTLLLLAALPWTIPTLGAIYWMALGIIAALLIWEHSLVRPDDLSRVNAAFFSANAIIGAVLLAAVGADVWV